MSATSVSHVHALSKLQRLQNKLNVNATDKVKITGST